MAPSWPFALPKKGRQREWIEKSVREQLRAVMVGLAPWPIAMLGDAGSGKSCAALCVCDWAGHAAYAAAPELCRMLRLAMDGKYADDQGYAWDERQIWKGWDTANVAVLDELGTREKATDFQYETIKRAIDARLDNECPLIVISNLTPGDIARVYDDRIASRIGSGTVIGMAGDRRFESF